MPTFAGKRAARDRVSRGRALPGSRAALLSTEQWSPFPFQSETPSEIRQSSRLAQGWLLVLILLVFAMVLVGGATRLTESGLSITEWNLVTGTVPPLERAGLAGGVRALSAEPAIRAAQSRHEPARFQDHLLVGMGASRARPLHRARLCRRLPLDRGAPRGLPPAARNPRRDGCAARHAGRRRLDHGRLRPGAGHDGGGAAQARASSHRSPACSSPRSSRCSCGSAGRSGRRPRTARDGARACSSSSPSCRSRWAAWWPATMPDSPTTPGR